MNEKQRISIELNLERVDEKQKEKALQKYPWTYVDRYGVRWYDANQWTAATENNAEQTKGEHN